MDAMDMTSRRKIKESLHDPALDDMMKDKMSEE